MKEAVFLMPWAPFDSDRRRLGIDALQGSFRVTVADLSPLLAPGRRGGPAAPDIAEIRDYDGLDAFLAEKREAVFFDFVLGASPVTLKYGRLFRALRRAGIRYAAVLASALPVPSAGNSGLAGRILFRLKSSAALPGYLAGLAAKRAMAALRARGLVYARPWRIYAVSRADAAGLAAACGLGDEVIRPVNSLDYSAVIEARRQGLEPRAGGTCVLIDEDLVSSGDFAYAGLKALAAEEFYPPLNAFLAKVRGELGLEPVIAAHPKAVPGELEKKYPGIRVIYGGTLRAVAEASLVLAHWSTALNFAVIFGKPALLLRSRAMQEKGLAGFVDTLAGALGARALPLDEALRAPLDFTPESLPRSGYAAYLARYIKAEGTPETTAWEAIAADLLDQRGG